MVLHGSRQPCFPSAESLYAFRFYSRELLCKYTHDTHDTLYMYFFIFLGAKSQPALTRTSHYLLYLHYQSTTALITFKRGCAQT